MLLLSVTQWNVIIYTNREMFRLSALETNEPCIFFSLKHQCNSTELVYSMTDWHKLTVCSMLWENRAHRLMGYKKSASLWNQSFVQLSETSKVSSDVSLPMEAKDGNCMQQIVENMLQFPKTRYLRFHRLCLSWEWKNVMMQSSCYLCSLNK